MNIADKRDQAFRNIQANPELWKAWNECHTQQDRDLILSQALWDMAYDEGQVQGLDEGYNDGIAEGWEQARHAWR